MVTVSGSRNGVGGHTDRVEAQGLTESSASARSTCHQKDSLVRKPSPA